MTKDQADRAFHDYRSSGDPSDLAVVFDATAAELLAVAEHLVRDPGHAEDLVQQTFLTAIEIAPRFRSGARVRPWLVGILHNHARRLRAPRGSAKASAQASEPPTPRQPDDVAASRETRESIVAALAHVPRPYREVLELRLLEELTTPAIATRLERAPGTARAQLSRGLAMLRSALPGVTLTGTLGAASVPSLESVRATVLQAAAKKLAAGASLSTTLAAGVLFMKGKAILGVAAALVALTLWSVLRESPAPLDPGTVGADSASAAIVAQRSAAPVDVVAESRSQAPSRRAVQPDATAVPNAESSPASESTAALPRIRILVVDSHSQPVPDAAVDVGIAGSCGGRLPPLIGTISTKSTQSAFGAILAHTAVDGRDTRKDPRAPQRQRGRTDDRGFVDMILHPGYVEVSASSPQRGLSGAVPLPPDAGLNGEVFRVVLRPIQRISGFVLDASDRPVEGAEVSGWRTHDTGLPTPTSPVTTDAAGAFSIVTAGPGRYTIWSKLGEQSTDQTTVELGADQSATDVVLRVPGAFVLSGIVLGPEGGPLESAFVQFWRIGDAVPDRFPFSKRVPTDARGEFEIALSQPSRYRVVARADGKTFSEVKEVDIDATVPKQHVTLQVRPPVSISGRVTDATGAGLEGLRVCAGLGGARDDKGIYLFDLYGPYPAAETRTDASGAYEVEGLNPDGRYTVTVFLDEVRYRISLKRRDVAGGTTGLSFVADDNTVAGAQVRGLVVDAVTRQPLDAFSVQLWKHYPDGSTYPEYPSHGEGAPGTFLLTDLALEKSYSLVVSVPGRPDTWVPQWTVTQPDAQITVEVATFGTLVCTTLHANGLAAANHEVQLECLREHPRAPRLPRVITDEHGFTETRLPPGRYRATAGGESQTFEVHAGQRVDLDLRLAP